MNSLISFEIYSTPKLFHIQSYPYAPFFICALSVGTTGKLFLEKTPLNLGSF